VSKPSPNRSASDVAIISLCGRFLTFIGRTLYIGRFGAANPLLNAFTYALHVPQVMFNLVGTALSTVMIPVYNSLLAEDKRDEAKEFIDNVISISIALLVVITLIGVAASPLISRLVGGAGFEESAYLTFALRFLLPMMIFFGFGAIFTGLLQSHGRFRLPALVSAPGGVFLIAYLIFFGERFGVTGLIFATALGVVSQPLLMLPAVKKLGYRYAFSFDFKNKNIRAAGRLCIPVFISVASYQAHFLFAHSMALRMGAAAIMDYAQQLVQVFILIIVLAVAAVYFPKLSALWAKKNGDEYNENLTNALLYTLFLVLPTACGMFFLRFEIMDFLLNWRGEGDTQTAGNLMGLYAVGIVAISMKEIADRGFYSMQDSKTPAVFGLMIMAVNIGATVLLIPRLGVYAMPTAYAIAAICGVLGLFTRLHVKIRFISRKLFKEIIKIIFVTIIMVAAVLAVQALLPMDNRLLAVLLPAAAGAGVYFAAAYALKISTLPRHTKWNAF
jgi:putative peptidoglycan lipid II flippase